MNYQAWEQEIPETIKADPLWKTSVYRFALFLGDLSWHDVTKLQQDRRMRSLSDQLYRASGSISANIAEGYSRGTGKDRARFYEYSLGSARECRDWYHKGRHILGEEVVTHRFDLLENIIRLLLTIIPKQRGGAIREENGTYQADFSAEVPMP